MITPQQNDAEPTAETTVDLSYTDELGEYDFEDYTFNFITRDNGWSYSNMIAEEQDGEVLSDAIFKRQQTVSERFNVQFAETFGDTNTVKTKFKEAVLAGDNAYDMITARGMDMYTFAQEGLLNPVSALPRLFSYSST